jgi:hypothetical protein
VQRAAEGDLALGAAVSAAALGITSAVPSMNDLPLSGDAPTGGSLRPACRHRVESNDLTAAMTTVAIDLETLSAAERRDLANALLRAAWSATLAETRILLFDLLTETDVAVVDG